MPIAFITGKHLPQVDLAVAMFPGVIAAPLILGTLAGSGGKLIVDAIRHHWTGLLGPAEASVPTFVWRSAALASGGYWAACKYTSYLTSQEAAALVITVLVRRLKDAHELGGRVPCGFWRLCCKRLRD